MKVHYVKSARKSTKSRKCRACGNEVQPKESYKWAEPRFGPIMIWCHQHSPRRSDLTSSKMGAVYDAQDLFKTEANTIDDLQMDLQSVADVATEVKEEYEESIANMPEALQESSPAAEDMRERIEALEEYASNLEDFNPDEQMDDESDDEFVSRIQDEAQDLVNDFGY